MPRNRQTVQEILIFESGAAVESVFFYEGIGKNGERAPIKSKLIDYEGQTITGSIWENVWEKLNLDLYDYDDKFIAQIIGKRDNYNGEPQVTITDIIPLDPSDDEYSELLNVYTDYRQMLSPEKKEEYARELISLINSVQNKYYHQLLVDLFDEEMIETFKEWTAAWEMHHAFPGGLLVHTVNVAKKCKAIAEVSENIDKDLLITAALLHDIAKVKEYAGFPSKRRLYAGRLLFHASMGAEMIALQIHDYRKNITEEYLEVSDFPQTLEIQLKHCILSHHGLPEYGAAVKPMLLEAHILHMMDDADAKEEYFEERVINNSDFDANVPIDMIRGYYDTFTKEYSYPTMKLERYQEVQHNFKFEDGSETNTNNSSDDNMDDEDSGEGNNTNPSEEEWLF